MAKRVEKSRGKDSNIKKGAKHFRISWRVLGEDRSIWLLQGWNPKTERRFLGMQRAWDKKRSFEACLTAWDIYTRVFALRTTPFCRMRRPGETKRHSVCRFACLWYLLDCPILINFFALTRVVCLDFFFNFFFLMSHWNLVCEL